jgi:ParB-like chromosome segregation protein Spo0J
LLEQYRIRTLLKAKIEVLDVCLLKQHEEVEEKRLAELYEEIKSDGFLKRAIAVDLNNYIIIDGHHRYNVLKALGCSRIPALLVDYFSPILKVLSWKGDEEISKSSVIEAGLSGKLFPARTTRHVICFDGSLLHISQLEPEVNIPLSILKKG